MNELDSIQKSILEQMLMESHGEEGVDPLSFRAAHFDQIDQIEYLDTAGFIRKENERYFPSLTALIQLDGGSARRLLENAEVIFAALKAHYLEAQREPRSVIALAESVGLGLTETIEALSYMVEGPWWGGRSSSFSKAIDPYIQPAEQILRFSRFSDVIKQLQGWQAKRIRDRQLAFASALRSFDGNSSDPMPPRKIAGRQKPDWFSDLPESSRTILDETYSASSHGLKVLTAMGIRAAIDDLCLDLVGDVGGFKKKLETLRNKGFISELEESVLAAAIDVGSASAHRGHVPHESDITILFDIAEHMLKAQYVLPRAAERLKINTPDRPKK
jgi:hypothetical protein